MFEHVRRIPEVVHEAAAKKEIVRMGVPQGLPHVWAGTAIQAVQDTLPGVRLSLHEGTTEEQRQQLQSGVLDLGLIHLDAPELHTRHVMAQRIGLALPRGSALAGRESVRYRDMDGMRIMAHAAGELAMEQSTMMSAAEADGARVHWTFRRFSAHSDLIARAAGVDGVLSTLTSKHRHLEERDWIPLERHAVGAIMHTWVAWSRELTPLLTEVVDVLAATKGAEMAEDDIP